MHTIELYAPQIDGIIERFNPKDNFIWHPGPFFICQIFLQFDIYSFCCQIVTDCQKPVIPFIP
jgi:hypothetical protein